MSTDQDQAREIAERIARRVSGETSSSSPSARPQGSEVSSQLAAVRAGINDLQRKLAQLEAAVSPGASEQTGHQSSPITCPSACRPGNSLSLACRYQQFLFPSQRREVWSGGGNRLGTCGLFRKGKALQRRARRKALRSLCDVQLERILN